MEALGIGRALLPRCYANAKGRGFLETYIVGYAQLNVCPLQPHIPQKLRPRLFGVTTGCKAGHAVSLSEVLGRVWGNRLDHCGVVATKEDTG